MDSITPAFDCKSQTILAGDSLMEALDIILIRLYQQIEDQIALGNLSLAFAQLYQALFWPQPSFSPAWAPALARPRL